MAILAGVAATGFAFSLGAASAHFGLAKSEPEEGAAVESPEEITLWFTQVPADNSIAVRLVDGGGALVETDSLHQDAGDRKMFRLEVGRPLEAGEYSVRWRGIGQDGHAVRSDFSFSVRAR